jgi:hypothetical protein
MNDIERRDEKKKGKLLTAMRSFPKIRHHVCEYMPDSNYNTNN